MTLKDTIRQEMIAARKKGDSRLLGILRLLWSEIGYLAIDKEASDEEVMKLFKKEAKKRKDSIAIYQKVGDKARKEQEEYELEIILKYLPEEMSEEEIVRVVEEVVKGTNKRGGPLVGEVMKRLKGQADGQIVAKIVNQKYGN